MKFPESTYTWGEVTYAAISIPNTNNKMLHMAKYHKKKRIRKKYKSKTENKTIVLQLEK